MKKNTLILILFIFIPSYSQTTRVLYKNGIYGQNIDSLKLDNQKFKDIPKEQMDLIKDFIKNQNLVEFELIFDKDCSLYKKTKFLFLNKIKRIN